MKKGVGIILELDSSRILFEGSAYLLCEKQFVNGSFKNIFSKNKTQLVNNHLAFAKKLDEIRNRINLENTRKTTQYKNLEIKEYFKDKKNSILDIIMLVQSPVTLSTADISANYSIMYFEISDNLKLGMFINKQLAYILLGDDNE